MARNILFVVVLMLSACSSDADEEAVQPPRAPWGVYRGAGCDGVQGMQRFADWYGSSPHRGLDFFAGSTWEKLEASAAWATECWDRAGHMPMTFSIAMLPHEEPASLAEGAAGKYDEIYRRIAVQLVERRYHDAIIRVGWKFNGAWMAWSAGGREPDYIAYWRRIVTTMRSVPGHAFRFDWSVANAHTDQRAEYAYPGDEYVDIIGLDVYNQSWSPGVLSPEQRWQELLHGQHGLLWHERFAAAHKKPVSFPEWATGTRHDQRGAGDDPYFVRKMAAWIGSTQPVYHNYWDYPGPEYFGEISNGAQPNAGGVFHSTFLPVDALSVP